MKHFAPVLLALVLASFCISSSLAQDFICPTSGEIPTCLCRFYGIVSCTSVTQQSLENFFKVTREVNGIAQNDWITIKELSFGSGGPNFTQLDLTPFLHTNIPYFQLYNNPHLTKIVGPSIDQNAGLIHTSRLTLSSNVLTPEGFGNFFRYFSPDDLTQLTIYGGVPDQESQAGGEFLPGLGQFHRLQQIGLTDNFFKKVGSNAFRKNGQLSNIALYDNQIDEIAEDAFLIDDLGQNPGMLYINLNDNLLTQDSFHENHGLDRLNRSVNLLVSNNKISSLPANVFRKFLDAHDDNFIGLYGNPIFCDGEVKWLKNNRDNYQHRVFMAQCVNDPGQTVFNSTLVH